MQLEVGERVIRVRLSRRNLEALLHKLTMPGSARTITAQINGYHLVVVAEESGNHYVGREPGPMHPATEAFLNPKGRVA